MALDRRDRRALVATLVAAVLALVAFLILDDWYAAEKRARQAEWEEHYSR